MTVKPPSERLRAIAARVGQRITERDVLALLACAEAIDRMDAAFSNVNADCEKARREAVYVGADLAVTLDRLRDILGVMQL